MPISSKPIFLNKNLPKKKSLNNPIQGLFLLLLLFPITSCATPKTNSSDYPITPQLDSKLNQKYMHIKILNSIVLNQKKINSLSISELSGLAWDQDEQILYAVSDYGILYHIKLSFKDAKLEAMKVVYATPLKNKKGKALRGKYSDSEGLSLTNGNNNHKGDSRLIVSFEGKPRLAKYSPKGVLLAKLKIPRKLQKRKNYRSKNKALESVTVHPKYGPLTASEYPLKKDNIKYQTLYSTSWKAVGKVWHFAASKATNSAVTGLETLPDGNILIMERAFFSPFTPVVFNLRRLFLDNCNKKQECKTETLARFDGSDGWLLDNFEGLTHLRDNQYLVISDDNKNPFQRTILVHFEIVD